MLNSFWKSGNRWLDSLYPGVCETPRVFLLCNGLDYQLLIGPRPWLCMVHPRSVVEEYAVMSSRLN